MSTPDRNAIEHADFGDELRDALAKMEDLLKSR